MVANPGCDQEQDDDGGLWFYCDLTYAPTPQTCWDATFEHTTPGDCPMGWTCVRHTEAPGANPDYLWVTPTSHRARVPAIRERRRPATVSRTQVLLL